MKVKYIEQNGFKHKRQCWCIGRLFVPSTDLTRSLMNAAWHCPNHTRSHRQEHWRLVRAESIVFLLQSSTCSLWFLRRFSFCILTWAHSKHFLEILPGNVWGNNCVLTYSPSGTVQGSVHIWQQLHDITSERSDYKWSQRFFFASKGNLLSSFHRRCSPWLSDGVRRCSRKPVISRL